MAENKNPDAQDLSPQEIFKGIAIVGILLAAAANPEKAKPYLENISRLEIDDILESDFSKSERARFFADHPDEFKDEQQYARSFAYFTRFMLDYIDKHQATSLHLLFDDPNVDAAAWRAFRQKAEAFADDLEREWQDTPEDNTPKIRYHPSKQVKSVTDKLMNVFFSVAAPAAKEQLDGQRAMVELKYEGRKSKKDITLFYDYEYNENALAAKGIPKGFGGYEYFVATALDNLKDSGNDVVSFSKILEEMGLTGRPSTEDITKLGNALLKGATTTIHIDDRDVQAAWGNELYTELAGQVFPIKLLTQRYVASGFVADGAIKILDYSPFRTLADSLGHTTTWKKEILRLYTGRRTERYWKVMQFLIREIGWMRNDKSTRSKKILYSTLYANTGDTTSRSRQLARDMLYRLLDEVFKPTGYITSYKEDSSTTPGVVLTVRKNKELPG